MATIEVRETETVIVDDASVQVVEVPSVVGSIADHGLLTGLGDDDHPQYHNDARALTWLGTRSTADLPEGTRLYYTDARADARVTGGISDAGLTNDHGSLLGLGDDDHAGYLLLAGRGAQQDVVGGLSVASYLRVGSSTPPENVTAGDLTTGRLSIGNVAFEAVSQVVNVDVPLSVPAGAYLKILTRAAPIGDGASAQGINTQFAIRPTAADAGVFVASANLLTHDSGAFNLSGIMAALTTNVTQDVAGTTVSEMRGNSIVSSVSAGIVSTLRPIFSFFTGSGGTLVSLLNHFEISIASYPSALTTHKGLVIPNLGNSAVTNALAIDIAAQSGASSINFGIRNASNMVQTGYARFGAIAAPSNITNGDVNALRLFLGANAAMNANARAEVRQVTAAANQTGLYLGEGTPETVKQVRWKAGDSLVAGDKVLVLV